MMEYWGRMAKFAGEMNSMRIGEEYGRSLPAAAIAESVNEALKEHNRVVVTAPPGSGKSTLLPLTIAQEFTEGRIIMLEPRRAAARQIAMRMARMIGESAGQSVGYRMRFESKVSASTRIEVVTEGVMERMLVTDPTLEGVSAVIFDEFHERSLAADLALALTLEAQDVIRPDLKIVIMSATLEADELCERLKAPMVQGEGKMYDVDIAYGEDFEPIDCAKVVAGAVRRAYREEEGNILAFLPGTGEIARCEEMLEGALEGAVVLSLHGLLAPEAQYRAIEYNPEGKRKIVLATPIAETSLTIEGIRTVVDSGLYRTVRYDTATGLGRLLTERISQDMATQRAGRAGRLMEGKCYRLWSLATQHRMKVSRTPEIMEADLASAMLTVAAWGAGNPMELPWLTPPPSAAVADACRLLRMLGAVDEGGRITAHGERIAQLPCHPRIANMLVGAEDAKSRALGADIAAILEEKDPVSDDNDADINTRIAELRERRRMRRLGHYSRIASVAAQYRKMIRCEEDNSAVNPDDTGWLIAAAYPERVAMRLKDGVYRLPSGENVALTTDDDLSAEEHLAVASMGRRIFLASPVDKGCLREMAVRHQNVAWDSKAGRLVARDEWRIGVLVVESRSIEKPDAALVDETLARAARKDGRSMLDFNDDVLRLLRRLELVREWHPELEIPELNVDEVLQRAGEWLPMYRDGAVTRQELKKIDMCEVVKGIVGYEIMAEVDRLAPSHLRLPRGRNARIDYRSGAEAPVVSAKIQDCFGLTDTPKVDDGRRPVLMELLSPGFKPVQLTQDLRGFWTNTYYEVRKELKRRYPKHQWPNHPEEQ